MIAIHRFLLVLGKSQALAPIDATASLIEIIRVTKEDTAIMAIKDGMLVGTLGLIRVPWWYNPNYFFLTERWHFVLPEFHHGEPDRLLKQEARNIADLTGFTFIDMGKNRPQKDGNNHLILPRVYQPNQVTHDHSGSA